jgi:uncharacterized membrane protein
MRPTALREWIVAVLVAGIGWGIIAALVLSYTPWKSVLAGVFYGLFTGTGITVIRRFANRSAKPS